MKPEPEELVEFFRTRKIGFGRRLEPTMQCDQPAIRAHSIQNRQTITKLAPLFQFTAEERAFLDAVLNRGEIDASAVEAPENVCAAIETCPALKWKAQKVRAWKSADKSLAPGTRRGRRSPEGPSP
jgi:hypothetical protein